MSRRKYPRLDRTGKYKNNKGKLCECCDEKVTAFVWVQFTYMRGEDEKYDVCENHRRMATQEFDRFLKEAEETYQKREKANET